MWCCDQRARRTPVLLKDVATVQLGPQIRRGVLELDGKGDAVGGIVVMRHGENALSVIGRVKDRLEELKASLPRRRGDRHDLRPVDLIRKAIHTVTYELGWQMVIVSAVIMIFLWHIPSASVPILTIPVSVLLAFIPMY